MPLAAAIVRVTASLGDLHGLRPRWHAQRDIRTRPASPPRARRRSGGWRRRSQTHRCLEHRLRGGQSRSARPDDTWMERMAAACARRRFHTPRPSKMRRLALPSAVVRSSKLGCARRVVRDRLNQHHRALGAGKRQRAAGPDHAAADDCDVKFLRGRHLGARHHRFDLVDLLRRLRGQHLRAALRHHDIILDAYADVGKAARHAAQARRDIDTRLDGEHHAGLEHPPLAADFVVARRRAHPCRASARCGA